MRLRQEKSRVGSNNGKGTGRSPRSSTVPERSNSVGKKNLAIVGILLLVIAVVAGVGLSLPECRSVTEEQKLEDAGLSVEQAVEASASPVIGEAVTTEYTAQDISNSDAAQAKAYLLVTVNGVIFEPIPLLEERDYVISQKVTGAENVVRVTKESIAMFSSTCENQDCVKQGAVTLENRDARALENMIVCLPNGVILELLTPEEAENILQNSQAE